MSKKKSVSIKIQQGDFGEEYDWFCLALFKCMFVYMLKRLNSGLVIMSYPTESDFERKKNPDMDHIIHWAPIWPY